MCFLRAFVVPFLCSAMAPTHLPGAVMAVSPELPLSPPLVTPSRQWDPHPKLFSHRWLHRGCVQAMPGAELQAAFGTESDPLISLRNSLQHVTFTMSKFKLIFISAD